MLDLRKRVLLMVGVPVLIVLVLFGYLIFRSMTKALPSTQEIEDDQVEQEYQDDTVYETVDDSEQDTYAGVRDDIEQAPEPVTQQQKEELYVRQLSRMFIERFYSYSNQNKNEHLQDVLPLATQNMQKYILKQKVETSDEYIGVTTKLLSSEIVSLTETNAEVKVSVQQQNTTAKTTEKSQKSGKILFLKDISGQWKVDGVFLK